MAKLKSGTRIYGNATIDNQLTVSTLGVGTSSLTSGYEVDVVGDIRATGNLFVSASNAQGGGIILSDDGDIVDLNDGFASLRFSNGVRVYSTNKGGSTTITLGSNGQITSSSDISLGGELNFNNPANKYIDFYTRDASSNNYAAHFRLVNHDSSAFLTGIRMFYGGTVELYHNNTKTFETSSTGATVTGTLLATSLSTGAAGTGININNSGTITGPSTITIDPAAIGDDTGTVEIKGNLTVQGTTTTINSTTSVIADPVIELRRGNSITAADGGIQVNLTTNSSGVVTGYQRIQWNNTNTRWETTDGTTARPIATTTGNLSQFASTTSAQLAGVISDETGTGALVFASSPTLVTPILGNATSTTLTVGTRTLTASYNCWSETISGAMGIIGHNARSGAGTNTVVANNSSWHGHFIRMYYTDGIAIHTTTGTVTAGDVLYDAATPANQVASAGERVRITPAGDVGIGLTNPAAKLDVFGSAKFGGTVSAGRVVNITNEGAVTLAFGNNANQSNLILANVSDTGSTTNHGNSILWQFGTNTTTTPINAGRINILKEQQWTTTATTQDSYFSIDLTVDSVLTERFRISSAGDTTVAGDLVVTGGDISTAAGTNSTLFGNTTTGTIAIGGALTTGTLTLGSANGSGTISIGNTGTAAAQAVNIATATTGTITIGGTGATAVQLPTGKTKVGQTFLLQGVAGNITFPSTAGTLIGSGDTNTVTTTMISNNAVTYAKMQTVATANRLLGSTTAGGAVSEVQVATDMISNSAVTFAKMQNSAAAGLSVIGRSSNSQGVFAEISAANDGDVLRRSGTSIGFGTLTLENLPDAWVKRTVKAATTADLAAASSTATTLTGTLVVFPAQDGISFAVGDRLLVKNQTTAAQNGIYTLTTAGVAGTTAWVLTRATDADTASELAGATVSVDQGTTQGGFIYDTNFKTTDTVGTTACNFSRILDTGAVSGDATVANSGALTIANNAVTFAKIQNSAAAGLSVIGRSANSAGVFAEIAAGTDGHVLYRASSTSLTFGQLPTASIANSAITYAKIQNVSATDRLLGRSSAGAGVVEEITCTASGRSLIGLNATQGGILYGASASTAAYTSAGSIGQALISAGTGAPRFVTTPVKESVRVATGYDETAIYGPLGFSSQYNSFSSNSLQSEFHILSYNTSTSTSTVLNAPRTSFTYSANLNADNPYVDIINAGRLIYEFNARSSDYIVVTGTGISTASTTATGSLGGISITVSSATNIVAGQYVKGTGIATDCFVDASYTGGTTVPLTKANTGAVSGTVTFNTIVTARYTSGDVGDTPTNIDGYIVLSCPPTTTATSTLTFTQPATSLAIDGVTLSAGDRVLLTAQSSKNSYSINFGESPQNGIYTVTTAGTSWVLTRVSDLNTTASYQLPHIVSVTSGTAYSGSVFLTSGFTNSSFVLGTNRIRYVFSDLSKQSQNDTEYFDKYLYGRGVQTTGTSRIVREGQPQITLPYVNNGILIETGAGSTYNSSQSIAFNNINYTNTNNYTEPLLRTQGYVVPTTKNASGTIGTNTITVSDTTDIVIGNTVTGDFIGVNATVTAINTGTNVITLSANNASTFSNLPVSFAGNNVNYFGIKNNISGRGPILEALGTDTNVGIELLTKGTGVVSTNGDLRVGGGDIRTGNVAATLFGDNTTTGITIGGGLTTGTFTMGATGSTGAVSLFPATGAQNITLGGATTGTITVGSTSATVVQLPTGKTRVGASTLAQGSAAARTITLPDATTTLVGTDAIQTLSNKTFASNTYSTTQTLTVANDCVFLTASTAWTLTLPTPTAGKVLYITRTDSTAFIISVSGNINGNVTTNTSWFPASTANRRVILISNGTTWYPMAVGTVT